MSNQTTEKDLIYGVCHFLREEVEIATGEHTHCKGCELRVDSHYGPGTLGCVLRARELIELASANERTKRLQAEHERDVLIEKLALIAEERDALYRLIHDYVRTKLAGLGENATYWWELQCAAKRYAQIVGSALDVSGSTEGSSKGVTGQ